MVHKTTCEVLVKPDDDRKTHPAWKMMVDLRRMNFLKMTAKL